MQTKAITTSFETELNLTEQGLKDLAATKEGLLIDVATDAGFKLARKERVERNGIHKNIDRLAIDGKNAIDEARKDLKERVSAIFQSNVEAFEKEDLRRKQIAEQEAKKEQERIDSILQNIEGIKRFSFDAHGKSAAEISDIIEAVDLIDVSEGFDELSGEAAHAVKETLIELNGLLNTAITLEQVAREREEMAKERAELEALRREKVERERENKPDTTGQECVNRELINKQEEYNQLTDYQRGYIDGLRAYAYWKDGNQYVGKSGRSLDDAIMGFIKVSS